MADEERRKILRAPFVANAEIIEEGSRVKVGVRVSDISREGCYIDMRSPLPKGASVLIKITTATDAFEAEATVGYTHPHLGMGLIFRSVKPESGAVLEKWLMLATNQRSDDHD